MMLAIDSFPLEFAILITGIILLCVCTLAFIVWAAKVVTSLNDAAKRLEENERKMLEREQTVAKVCKAVKDLASVVACQVGKDLQAGREIRSGVSGERQGGHGDTVESRIQKEEGCCDDVFP